MRDFLQTIGIFFGTYFFLLLCCIHTVPEGYVGIYKKNGVLSPRLAEPGFHFGVPVFHTHSNIQISVRTDVIQRVPCGTSGGTLVYFQQIEVVNKLHKEYVYETVKNYSTNYNKFWIEDKVHH